MSKIKVMQSRAIAFVLIISCFGLARLEAGQMITTVLLKAPTTGPGGSLEIQNYPEGITVGPYLPFDRDGVASWQFSCTAGKVLTFRFKIWERPQRGLTVEHFLCGVNTAVRLNGQFNPWRQ